ncbi:MAG: copper-binding protein [Proteobacteria bacterium]|nr:copper-binding protein [Pseudomonadota bacterium]
MKALLVIVIVVVVVAGIAVGGYRFSTHEMQPVQAPIVPRQETAKPAAVLHKGRGIVTGVSAPDGYLELKHEPIPSMRMDAMQMGFAVADKRLLEGLKKGDEIEFEMGGLPNKDGDFVVERLERRPDGRPGSRR